VGAALREFFLEGLLVAGELGGGGAGGAAARGCCGACLVGVAGDVGTAVGSGYDGDRTDGGNAGAGGCLVELSAVTAYVDAAIVLVAVPVPAVVIALVAAAIPAGGFAASVLSWVCESGVASQGWVGELVEGWSGCGVDGALWGAGWGVVVWVDENFGEEDWTAIGFVDGSEKLELWFIAPI